ncbi:hypothetical protein V1502_08470 [Bacillus sp. SCS-153A]|uniref:hypothetical protein n=1 Tax=Rossellomorea sedimentorum TaxID=3115294 RepID=UPI003905CB42
MLTVLIDVTKVMAGMAASFFITENDPVAMALCAGEFCKWKRTGSLSWIGNLYSSRRSGA